MWSRENRPAAAAMLAALVSILWFELTRRYCPPFPESPWAVISLAGLSAYILAAGWLLGRMCAGEMRRARAMIRYLASGRFKRRLYVAEVEEEAGRLRLEINSLMDRVEEVMARQRQAVGQLSHDIRTPLTIIKGDIEVALMRPRSAEEYEEILRSNLEEVERIHRLVEDLVTLARADYGELGLNVRAVAMGSLVAEVRESFLEAVRRKGLALDIYLEGDVTIDGDEARLRRLLHNLVENAVNHTPEGGKIELSLLNDRERDQVQFRVRDTGIGISAPDLPHIFEPFFRGTPSRRTQHHGYGLGLAICDQIVRAHGGRIAVESRIGPGSGTAFTVYLNRRPRPA